MTLKTKLTRLIAPLAIAATSLLMLAAATSTAAQSRPAAYGPGSFVQIGGTASLFQIDYGQRYLGGETVFIDANLYRRFGIEAEARRLNLNADEGVHETTYLVGPRFSVLAAGFRPYGKFLIGRGQFYFPFQYAQSSYFVIAPGGGVDWRVRKSRFTVRIIDVEFQKWPWFTYGPLKPFGASSGIAFRAF